MALIKCKYCGHEVSDKAHTCPNCKSNIKTGTIKMTICPECSTEVAKSTQICPHCGYELKYAFFKQHKSILAVSIISICIIAFIVLAFNSNLFMSKNERYIQTALQEVQNHLLDPSSVVVYDCKINIDAEDENPNNGYVLVYFYLGARNKMGGYTDNEYMVKFINGQIDSIADNPDEIVDNAASGELLWVTYMGFGPQWLTYAPDVVQKLIK